MLVGEILRRFIITEFHFYSLNFVFVVCLKFERSYKKYKGLPGGASGEETAWQCRRHKRCKFDFWSRRSPGGWHGNPLWYSCLESPINRGAWRAAGHSVQRGSLARTCA